MIVMQFGVSSKSLSLVLDLPFSFWVVVVVWRFTGVHDVTMIRRWKVMYENRRMRVPPGMRKECRHSKIPKNYEKMNDDR